MIAAVENLRKGAQIEIKNACIILEDSRRSLRETRI
jgi:hypothetical protein